MFQTEIKAAKTEVLKLVLAAHRGIGIDPGHTNQIADELCLFVSEQITKEGADYNYAVACCTVVSLTAPQVGARLQSWDRDCQGENLRFADIDYAALAHAVIPFAVKLVALERADDAMAVATGWMTAPRQLAA